MGARVATLFVLITLLLVGFGNAWLLATQAESRLERGLVAGLLLVGGAVALEQFLAGQRRLGASVDRLHDFRQDWSRPLGTTWADRALGELRSYAGAHLPSVQEACAPHYAEAERDVTVLRWFSTGAVLVGLTGTLFGLSGAVGSAVDLLRVDLTMGTSTANGMAKTLVPLTISFWSSLSGVALSVALSLARQTHEAEVDSHFADLEGTLARVLTTDVLPEWRSDADRMEGTMRDLVDATARFDTLGRAIADAVDAAVVRAIGEVRSELQAVPPALADATKAGLASAGADILERLVKLEKAREAHYTRLEAQIAEHTQASRALLDEARREQERLQESARAFASLHAEIAARTDQLLSSYQRTADAAAVAHGRNVAAAWDTASLALLDAQAAQAKGQADEVARASARLVEQIEAATAAFTRAADQNARLSHAVESATTSIEQRLEATAGVVTRTFADTSREAASEWIRAANEDWARGRLTLEAVRTAVESAEQALAASARTADATAVHAATAAASFAQAASAASASLAAAAGSAEAAADKLADSERSTRRTLEVSLTAIDQLAVALRAAPAAALPAESPEQA